MSENKRLKELQKILEFSSQEKFAKTLGIKQGSLSDIYRAKSGIRVSDSIKRTLEKVYSINIDWLETGDGDVVKEGGGERSNPYKGSIRLWTELQNIGGQMELVEEPKNYKFIDINIPEFKDCTDAINMCGKSMEPKCKAGQILLLKKWKESYIDYGNIYLIITKGGHGMVKIIQAVPSNNNQVECVSCNHEYSPFVIEKENIVYLYLVKGSIENMTL